MNGTDPVVHKLHYFNWFTDSSSSAAMIDYVVREFEQGGKHSLLTCSGALKSCWKNPVADQNVCKRCRFWRAAAVKNLPIEVNCLEVDDVLQTGEAEVQHLLSAVEYETIDNIRQLKVFDAWVGWGALSTYISQAKQSLPRIDTDFRKRFDILLSHAVRLAYAAKQVLGVEQYSEVSFFNGRTGDTRPIFDVARDMGLDTISVEIARNKAGDFRRQKRRNSLPQDVDVTTVEVEKLWQESLLSPDERCSLVKEFYEGRRNGKGTGDVQAWAEHQVPGTLPRNWNPAAMNLVFFTSSEFEVAAIKEIQERSPFASQILAIREVAQIFSSDGQTKLTVRIHPNEANGRDPIDHWYGELAREFENVEIVDPTSNVSTYGLIDRADVILTSSSSVGIEAAYWGKPVILMGRPGYSGLGSCYLVERRSDVERLVLGPLRALDREGAKKYAFWLMAVDLRTDQIEFNARRISVGGRLVHYGHDLYRLAGSRLLFWIVDWIRFRIAGRFMKPQFS